MKIEKIKTLSDLKLNKNSITDPELINIVLGIIEEIKTGGDAGIIRLTKKFDGADIENIKVSENEIKEAFDSMPDCHLKMFERIRKNIEDYQRLTKKRSWITIDETHSTLGEIITPVESAGLYIPGGTAPLISTVFMSAIPAYIAGVKKICVCSPPDKKGQINPYILAAAKMCGVNDVFKVGGAQAIAALAYGTETIKKVEKIAGPGNIYVTLAKKLVYGEVDIDMVAGPSEILVYADETANTEFVIADLLSQAEHDTLASSYLITTSNKIAEFILSNIMEYAKKLPRFEIIKKSLANNFRIFLTDNDDASIDIINTIAPEHLELCIKNADEILKKIRNAGAVFIGNYTPEAVGDYYAGPSHILPTAATSRFFSPVSVNTFLKRTSLIRWSENKFKSSAHDIIAIAELEELNAHAFSAAVRLK